MNSRTKTVAERAERSEAKRARRLTEHEHEHEDELHKENGHRASPAKRDERGAPLNTSMNKNMNSTMGTGAEQAERSEASEVPPLAQTFTQPGPLSKHI